MSPSTAAVIVAAQSPAARAQRPRVLLYLRAPPPSTSAIPARTPPREPNIPERRRPHAAAQSLAACSRSPRRRLCAPSPYVRHAPPWPCHCSAQPLPPAGAALTLMCLEISLNMDYLFRNYVVKYRLFLNLFNFDDK